MGTIFYVSCPARGSKTKVGPSQQRQRKALANVRSIAKTKQKRSCRYERKLKTNTDWGPFGNHILCILPRREVKNKNGPKPAKAKNSTRKCKKICKNNTKKSWRYERKLKTQTNWDHLGTIFYASCPTWWSKAQKGSRLHRQRKALANAKKQSKQI